MTTIKFSKNTSFLGRNGWLNTTALLVKPNLIGTLTMAPLTTKGVMGRCQIQIPFDCIPNLVSALKSMQSTHEIREIPKQIYDAVWETVQAVMMAHPEDPNRIKTRKEIEEFFYEQLTRTKDAVEDFLTEMQDVLVLPPSGNIPPVPPPVCHPLSTFVIYGHDASETYHKEGMEALIEGIKDQSIQYELREFPANTPPAEVLDASDGWNGYATLTENEYNQLLKL